MHHDNKIINFTINKDIDGWMSKDILLIIRFADDLVFSKYRHSLRIEMMPKNKIENLNIVKINK